MEIVPGGDQPRLERADAVRLLGEMAAVVRTIFAVDVHGASPGAGAAPMGGGTAPAPVAEARPAGAPASLPVPGAAILQEIAFLDE